MIITKTPLRISFIGGGTDLPAYYENGYGAVVSTTINKYIYITLNKRFDDTIRLSYSQTENVDHVEDLKHDMLKLALRWLALQGELKLLPLPIFLPVRG